MAVVESLSKVQVRMQLENGRTSTGKVSTVPVSLGTLNVGRYDNQKAMNIVEKLSSLFAVSLYVTQKTGTSDLSVE